MKDKVQAERLVVTSEIQSLEDKVKKAKTLVRQQTEEVHRLQDFRRIKVVNVPIIGKKKKTQTIPIPFNLEERKGLAFNRRTGSAGGRNGSASPRTQAAQSSQWNTTSHIATQDLSQMPVDLTQTMPKSKNSTKLLTVSEAQQLVQRLAQKAEHRNGCKCELCQAGGAVSHVRSFKPKKVRSSYSRSRSRSARSSSRKRN